MRYPTLSNDGFAQLVRRRFADGVDVMAEAKWLGNGDDIDLTPIDDVAADVVRRVAVEAGGAPGRHPDDVEGEIAGPLHRVLHRLPTRVLDDPGFWRFLSLGDLWAFVRWRERSTFDGGEPSKYLKYVDGKNPAECVLMRTYLRGAIAEEAGDHALAAVIPQATDLWRSHILRVRTASAPEVAKALLRSQRDDRMPTPVLREFAKRLNRTWTNVVLHTYDDEEADRLIQELREA